MCTVVILRRPGHDWPLLLAANRDEMADRPSLPPGRHWPDRPDLRAGRDQTAGGTWLGLNDHGVVASVLNRLHTLGPMEGFRSRGELPLEALDHAEAGAAAEALVHLEPTSYRPFNMVVADNREAYWLRSTGGAGGRVEAMPLPEGLSMITAHDRNDPGSPRMRRFLPLFREATPPDPEANDWSAWIDLLCSRESAPGVGPDGAMTIVTDRGFETVSSSIVALPAAGRIGVAPIWLFASGRPVPEAFKPVAP